MIKRIVKMSFEPGKAEEFKLLFKANRQLIRNFEGCTHLELLQDEKDPSVFFTYSIWKDQDAVENYRQSDLFVSVWSATKQLFNAKPEAWSVREISFD